MLKICVYGSKPIVSSRTIAEFLGRTALFYAASEGFNDIVISLIKAGAAINERDNEQYTAIMRACENNHFKVARTLLLCGADIYKEGSDGMNAKKLAEKYKYEDVINLLDCVS